MKKIFVLCLCFCLLFSQNAFSIEKIVIDSTDVEVNSKSVIAENAKSETNSFDFKNDKKCSGQACLSTTEDNNGGKELPKKLSESVQKDTELNEVEINKQDDARSVTGTGPVTTDDVEEVNANLLEDTNSVVTGLKPITTNATHKNNDSAQDAPNITPSKIEPRERETLSFDDKIRINEILPKPTKNTDWKEFIEFYNSSDSDEDLKDLWLCDKNAYGHFIKDKKHKCYPINRAIDAHDFLTLYKGVDFTFTLNNTNEKIILIDNDKKVLLDYDYKTSTEGISWNYDDVWYEETPTPHEENKANPLTKEYPYIMINEILPNPIGDESSDEFIELYNPTNTDINLKNWFLRDASKTGKYVFDDVIIASKSFLTIYRKDFKFALNNSGDETVSLVAPNTQIKSTISYRGASEDLSYNHDTPQWYWETPTPNNQNIQNPLTKEYPAIYLNEILPNPVGDENTDEFIEIYNPTDEIVSLKNWGITDASKTGSYTFTTQEIAPQSYFVIYRSDFRFALNNSGDETVSLIAPNGKIISSMSYIKTRENISLNRAQDWYFAEMSPNHKNADDPRTKIYAPLLLTEVLPNPIGNENTDEFIEIYNPNDHLMNLKYWTLRDASKTGSYTFINNAFIAPQSYFVIYRKDFSFALNNGKETVSLIAPNEKIMSSTTYKKAREGVSYNFEQSTQTWRWSKYLTPNKENTFNNLPTITKFEIDDDSYKDVYTSFSAKAFDSDNETLKVHWDFGDGRKSYLWKTRHKYTATGIYHGHLRIQDGSEEIIKKFTVIVKKYPKHKMKITKIVPNPAGKDSGTEYIVIKNKSKKKINLKNWSIATGSSDKTIVNHPVNKKLVIRPGKSKIITKKYAAISLPNKTGVIEIRRPNGSVADTKEYGYKSLSIPDNASYEKIDGVWQWLIPQDLTKLAQTQAIIAQALKNEQILSQQALESYIAFNAIYNPSEDVTSTNAHQSSFLTKLLQKINYLLNIAIMQTRMALHNQSQPTRITYTAPLYTIPHATNPCKQPTIFASHNLHFCE